MKIFDCLENRVIIFAYKSRVGGFNMADNKLNNYTLIEVLHLTYLARDSFEYCFGQQMNVSEENFQRRANMAKNMLAEGNFVQKWITNHPNEEVRKFYQQFVEYFSNIYEKETYVSHETKKVEQEKIVDFAEETIKIYQVAEDILNAFYNEYKKQEGLVNPDVEKAVLASQDYYRVIANWLLFNEVVRNDGEYNKARRASNGQTSYEVNYNLNILKRLIGMFNFNRQRYLGDKVDIKQLFEDSMTAFKSLDGTLIKDKEEKENRKLTQDEIINLKKECLEKAGNENLQAIRVYETIWKETYQNVVKYMQENPLNNNQQAQPAEKAEEKKEA